MSNVALFKSNLPAANIAQFKQAVTVAKESINTYDGASFLKLGKSDGLWYYGLEDTEVQPGSQWAINPGALRKGFIAWGKGEVLGKLLRSIMQPPVLSSELPPTAAKNGWQECIAMQLVCVSGEDKGQLVEYEQTSIGGLKGFRAVLDALDSQMSVSDTDIVPIVTLGSDSYDHKEFGKIHTPIFEVVRWAPMDGVDQEVEVKTVKAEVKPEPEKPVVARRRRAPAAA